MGPLGPAFMQVGPEGCWKVSSSRDNPADQWISWAFRGLDPAAANSCSLIRDSWQPQLCLFRELGSLGSQLLPGAAHYRRQLAA